MQAFRTRVDRNSLALLLAGGVSSAVILHAITDGGVSTLQALGLIVGISLAAAATMLTTTNFWGVVLGYLLVRVSLDGLKTGSVVDVSLMDPAALVGATFIVMSAAWLAGQAISGSYRPASLATKLLYGLVAWSLLGAMLSSHRTEALAASSRLLAGVLMLAVLEQMLPGRPDRAKQLLSTVLASAAIPILLGLYQGIAEQGDTLSTSGFNRVVGPAVNPVSFANYLIIVLLVLVGTAGLWRSRRLAIRLLVGAGIGATGLVLFWTFTRSAWLVAAAGVLLLLVRLNRFLLLPLVGTLVAVPVLVPDVVARFADLQNQTTVSPTDAANSLSWRVDYWHQVLTLAEGNQITGVGLDTVQFLTEIGLKPHNILVQAYVEMGIVGAVLLVSAFSALGLHLHRRRTVAQTEFDKVTANLAIVVALCMLIEGLTTNPLASTMLWWYTAAALTYGYSTGPAPEHRPSPANVRAAGDATRRQ